jgi:hypothetical protein
VLLAFLARIFSACFKLRFTPEQWRRAENFVLHKGKGDRKNVNNFRAISLTQIMAKVYERVLFSRLWAWFRRSPIFRLPQFGFRPGSSTVDAIFVLVSLIRQHLVVFKQPCHVAFVDITKAFPSVNRQELFNRLRNLGVPVALVNAVTGFYNTYMARLRIGTRLTASYLISTGLLEGTNDL